MMTLGFCNQIWIPLFTFPTVEAPRFPNGYPAATVFEFTMWAILMFGTWYMKRWKQRNPDLEMRLAREAATRAEGGDGSPSVLGSESEGLEDGKGKAGSYRVRRLEKGVCR